MKKSTTKKKAASKKPKPAGGKGKMSLQVTDSKTLLPASPDFVHH